MAGEAVNMVSTMQSLQAAWLTIFSASLTQYQYPDTEKIANNSNYDIVVVGGGTAGSTVAGRLSENSNLSVLVLEAGGYAPIESDMSALFPLLASSQHDWNLFSVKDNYTGKNNQDNVMPVTAGKSFGGSSILDHLLWVPGAPGDFSKWATAANDSSWNYTGMLEYFLRAECLQDTTILNSTSSEYHGVDGRIGLTKEPYSDIIPILEALAENYPPLVDDITGKTVGVCEPLLKIASNKRQNNALAYLSRNNSRSNLHISTYSTVTKLLLDDTNTAYGVQYMDADGETYSVYANKEVIVAGGAIFSPQLLMLAGIGPKEHLEDHGIPVVVDLPVGTLQDHVTPTLIIAMNATNETEPATDPFHNPVAMITEYKDYDGDGIADYQGINLIFPKQSSALLQMCTNAFKFNQDFCQLMYDQGGDRILFYTGVTVLSPQSRGRIMLQSTDPTAPPLIHLGHYSNATDLVDTGLYLAEFYKIINTAYFKAVGAEMLSLNLCTEYSFGSPEYWQCYALETSFSMWHYCGTCAMGAVVDARLRVHGVSHLRVVDAAAVPHLTRGKIGSSVTVLAEKAADLIMEDWDL